MPPRFCFLPVTSPLHDEAALERVLAALEPGLTALGGVRGDGDGHADAPLVVVALTGGTEQRMLAAWHTGNGRAPWQPFVVVAHGGHNSLPAALEALARVQQEGGRGRIVYVDGPDDRRAWAELDEVVAALDVRGALTRLRIGVVGAPSDWLVASMPPADVVARRWGPTLVPLAIAGAVDAARAAHPPAALVESVVGGATSLREPDAADVAVAAQVVPALADLVADHHLDAVTVRCFDLVTDVHTSGCVALAELNDRGVTAGCEGDVVSTVTMAWVRLLLDGAVPWMANPARVDVAANRVLLAHCTIARSLLSGYRLRSHFESGLGVAIDGDIDADVVTLVRVGGKEMDRLWLAEGAVVASPHDDDLCRTQLHVALDRGDVRDLLAAPLGNHIVAVPGRHADRLRSWWELLVAGD